MTDFIAEFLDTLRAAGFEPKSKIVPDDKWHPAFYMGEKGKCSGTYSMKICNDGFAIGCYFTRKDPDNKFKWHSNSGDKISAAERKKINAEIKAQQAKKEIEEDKRHRKISKLLSRAYKNLEKATDDHPYLKSKGIKAGRVKIRPKGNELIIPLYGCDGKIWTIQRILPNGKKFLFAGGKKRGSYYPLCTSKEDLSIILLCEGYSTGRSIRQATKLPVIAGIDSGNIKPALVALKAKYSNTKFIICADNDAFTKNPKGDLWNVGIEAAHKAAEAIGGAFVVSPHFNMIDQDAYNKEKPTDFNDLHAISGLDEVKTQLIEAVNKIPAKQEQAVSEDENSQLSDQHLTDGDPLQGDFGMNFKVLGHDEGIYYYFPFKERQIVALTPSQHSSFPNLFRLDHYDAWLDKFGSKDGKTPDRKIITCSTNALMELAKNRGIFKEEDRVRGCGAWLDNGRKILHCGDILYVDGVETKFNQLESEYTYVASIKLLRPSEPLGNREAFALREICEKITWENKLSGSLLAGWIVIAPICGALPYRPHIYITGEAESGKSTVLREIIKPVLGKISVNVDGGTTEPAIRQRMGYDARPLVYDEAEKSPSMTAVIEYSRKASDGGTVEKFGQRQAKVRSCVCFSAINPPVNKTADESRISFMVIKKNRKPTAMQEYNDLMDQIEKTITPEYSSRMIARTLANMDTLFENIKVFQKAARVVVKSARAAQVIGSMIAGLYLLSKTDVATPEFAQKWIEQHDWSSHTMIEDDTDPVRLLQYISGSILRVQYGGSLKEFSIGDLIVMAAKGDELADKILRNHGIAVKDKKVHIASRCQNLEKILKDTDWSIKWTRMLSNIEGAKNFRIFYFGVGVKTSGVSLPLKIFTEGNDNIIEYEPEQPELVDLDDEQEIAF